MKSNNANQTDSSIRISHGRARASRVLILTLCLAVLGVAAALPSGFAARVSAAIQQAASRVTTPAAKPKPGARVLRQSKDSQIVSQGKAIEDGTIIPDKIISDQPIQQTTAEIMEAQAMAPSKEGYIRPHPLKQRRSRENLPGAPGAIEANQWPIPDSKAPVADLGAPQTLGTQFDGATGPAETGAFPPDTMGAVGPTQVVVFLNGRLRTFNKTTALIIVVHSKIFYD